jgi:glutaredoxin
MKLTTKHFAIIGIVVVAAIAVYYIGVSLTGRATEVDSLDGFAECLTEKGITMYGAEWCSHCNNQKKMFGSSFKYVNYVECPKNPNLCNSKGIRGYPTWEIDGEMHSGERSLESLSSLSDCPLQ